MTTTERIDTEEEFYGRLQELVEAASTNGVDIVGGWPVLNDDPCSPDWDVEIVELVNTDR